MLAKVVLLWLVSAPVVARRLQSKLHDSLHSEQHHGSVQLNTDANTNGSTWLWHVPNLETGPALPISSDFYGTRSPFCTWYPRIPKFFGQWEEKCLSDYNESYVSQNSPIGIRQNDHNFNTPLGQGNTIGFVTAKLSLGERPNFTRYGLFAENGTMDAVIRFSDFGADTSTNRLMRIALKLPLKSAWGNEVNLLFTETLDSFPIKDYAQLSVFALGGFSVRSAASAAWALGLLRGGYFKLKRAFKLETFAKTFYSQLPYMLGDKQAMKFSLLPRQKTCLWWELGSPDRCCLPAAVRPSNAKEARQFAKLRISAMANFLARCPAVFELQLQIKQFGLWSNYTIFHGASVSWHETPVTVGTLTIPRQDLSNITGVTKLLQSKLTDILKVEPEGVDKMFNFHPIATHKDNRPIGDISEFRAGFYSQHAAARYSTFEKGVFKSKDGTPTTRSKHMPFDELKQAGVFGV